MEAVTRVSEYLMESEDETRRLEVKTDEARLREQALWCGISEGMRVLDVGCGPGKTTSIFKNMVGPHGSVVGIDASEVRIAHARNNYGNGDGIDFRVMDLTKPLDGLGTFDVIWVRFVLEYFRKESPLIIENLKRCLKPGGSLCLLDLDHNCLNHYELPELMAATLSSIMERLDRDHDFDPYAGRKLYSYLFDKGFDDIEMNIVPHHLHYGDINPVDTFNWFNKVKVVAEKVKDLLEEYPGGYEGFISDFEAFFRNPRRFTYTVLIMCRGRMSPP